MIEVQITKTYNEEFEADLKDATDEEVLAFVFDHFEDFIQKADWKITRTDNTKLIV